MLKPGTLEELKPDMLRVIAASQAEDGCHVYSFGVDLTDANVIRVYEEWESQEHLRAHYEAEHFKAWRARFGEVGFERRDITVREAGAQISL